VNLTWFAGILFLLVTGATAWSGLYPLAIAAFLGIYVVQNLRRPMVVGYLSDLVSHRTMATGLSVEVQLRTLLMAGLAPLVGLLADRMGVGEALVTVAIIALVILPLLKVRDANTTPDGIPWKVEGDR